jgi:hypothetical protein
MSIFNIWCKLCALAQSLMLLCQNLSILNTNLTTISMNNVILKEKITTLVGDPDAPCPDCPPPTEEVVAQQGVTQQMVETTEMVQAATAAIKEQTAAIKSKLSFGETRKAEEKKEEGAARAAEAENVGAARERAQTAGGRNPARRPPQ